MRFSLDISSSEIQTCPYEINEDDIRTITFDFFNLNSQFNLTYIKARYLIKHFRNSFSK